MQNDQYFVICFWWYYNKSLGPSSYIAEYPPQILCYLDGDRQTIPVLELKEPVKLVTMKQHKIQKQLPVNTNSDSQHGFWLMGTRVRLLNIHMTPTACCGLMCDAIDTNHKHCACYVASDSQASIVLCLQLQIVPPSTGGGGIHSK